jgi:hypothetical protein
MGALFTQTAATSEFGLIAAERAKESPERWQPGSYRGM